jgi:hypothetical protein
MPPVTLPLEEVHFMTGRPVGFVWIDRYYGAFYPELGSQLKKREFTS